jgi:indolepyruvate ferredoxin oxidoreductase
VFLTGTQAIVRIALDQARRDRAAGLNTAGFISGYRGSPLGGVDQELWRASGLTKALGIEFMPAVNEDLAATAVLGTQQVETQSERTVDGVFALWYGKGPGLWLQPARRGSGCRRRRSWLRFLLHAAPVGRRFHDVLHANA